MAMLLALFGCASTVQTAPVAEPAVGAPTPAVAAATGAWDPAAVCAEPSPDLQWKPLRGGLRHAAAAIGDLDGDGRPERFTVLVDGGSGSSGTELVLTLSTGDRIQVDALFSFNDMVHWVVVPKALQGPDKAAWRAPFEQELLHLKCDVADPSLRWLLRPGREPERVKGLPVIPPMYGMYLASTEQWLLYSGHTHTMSAPAEGQWPIEDEVRGPLHLMRTQHGVILYDADRDEHRWLHASEHGLGKLRWATVTRVGFEPDGSVFYERAPSPADLPADPTHIKLATGLSDDEG